MSHLPCACLAKSTTYNVERPFFTEKDNSVKLVQHYQHLLKKIDENEKLSIVENPTLKWINVEGIKGTQ